MFKNLVLILLMANCLGGYAQDCADPLTLCAEEAEGMDIIAPNPASFGCFDAQQTFFYSFETNNNAQAENFVDISITSINCPGSAGADSLFAIVVQYVPGADPCDPIQYINQSDCYQDTIDFSFEVDNLSPNSQYFVIIGSNQDPLNGPCGFDVSIAGEPVDIQGTVYPIVISLGESATMEVTGGDTLVGYNWNPIIYLDVDIGSTVVSTPDQTTSYIVEGQVGECTVTDIVTVTVGPPIVIYNAFTPNGDGFNDTWTLDGIERFENCLVTVYDRWGQQVFKSLGYTKPWNGTADGRYLPTASYYYVIELHSIEVTTKPISGAVAIIN